MHLQFGVFLLFAFSLVVVIAQLVGKVILVFSPTRLQRKYQSHLQKVWVDTLAAMFPPLTLSISGDVPDPNKSALLLANHQVDADWWFLWMFGKHYGKHGHVKLIMKEGIKWWPVIGHGMQNFEFMFLKDKFSQEHSYLKNVMQGFHNDMYPLWVMLFPEGTTLHREAHEQCRQYAKKNEKRPVMKSLLLPRSAGFCAVLEAAEDSIQQVLDVTVIYSGYSGEMPSWDDGYTRKRDIDIPNLSKLLRGIQAPKIYLHVQKYDVNVVREQGAQSWLDDRWKEKDELLSYFAAHGCMPESHKAEEVYETGDVVPISILFALEVLGAWATWAVYTEHIHPFLAKMWTNL